MVYKTDDKDRIYLENQVQFLKIETQGERKIMGS